ncbi:MAG TPA: heat-inducible transcriptional repressor HrcA [Alphaproteobacteria bacterium]|nr:heat-inducible transcriptional repressor HrcA [Alphaproteobacteria bacterium]
MKTSKQPSKPQASLNPRAAQVLADVAEHYAETGEPVGSKTLVDNGKYNLSGASIRNVMQDLEHMGLLTHPHTSAGRIPTTQGYRYYAQHLVEVEEPSKAIKQSIESVIKTGKSMPALVHELSGTISNITRCATLITIPKMENDPLEQLDFIRMSGDRVMAVMVTKSGEIENRVMEVPAFIGADDLHKAAQGLAPMLKGHTLEQARAALVGAIAEQKGQVNEMIDQMMAAAGEWGQPVTADGAMVVAGSTTLFQYPELVRDKLQSLLKVFEEKRLLMALVEEVKKGPGVKVFVGNDVPVDGVNDVAVIAAPYGHQKLGTIGVIGPQRLNYKTTLGVVNYTQFLLNKLTGETA